ncbi:MAG: cyclase family protein [Pseudomonadota bacterium]|nr:cyclase family protein [Pseudomonadota bacterium]
MKKFIQMGLFAVGVTAAGTACALAQTEISGVRYYDFTHSIPMFAPTAGDITKPDLSKPFKNSKPVASFGFQATRKMKKPFKTQKGFFQWGWFHFDEHYTTHLDSTDHYLNKNKSRNADKRSVDQYTLRDIIGPIVYIDISGRVTKELAKNGGKPSPNTKVTSFSTSTGATVLASDIENVAAKIVDRAWIVVHSGWDKFFVGKGPKNPFMHPYINGLNYPGFGKDAVEKLIEIENRKGVQINGIVMDNLSIDSGESGRGSDGKNPYGDGWYAHQLGLARGWKLLENASGTGQLANEKGNCTLIAGAIRLTSASGAPARVIAACR